MKNLKSQIQNITKPIMRKNGFVTPKIIFDWPLIVGEYLAKYTTPIKIHYPASKNCDGTLHIEVISAQSPIIQQLQPEIIEKIAVYCGFRAVARIKLIHTNKLPNEELEVKTKALTSEQSERLDKMLAGLEDGELRNKLMSMGEYVIRKSE